MKTTLLAAAAALSLVAATAQAASAGGAGDGDPFPFHAPAVAASAAGRWLYDAQGNTIGSVRGLADGGRTAVIMVGSYFRPGSYEARVPASALSVVDGKVTLRTETIQALNAGPRSRG